MELKRNAYFVPGEGISREVITADICKYLDNDAVVRPGEYQGQKGFILHAYRNLTTAMLEDLRSDSKKWEQEKRQRISQPQQQQQQQPQQQQQQQHQQQRQPQWGQQTGNMGSNNSAPDYTDSRTHQLRQQASYTGERNNNSPSPSMPSTSSYPTYGQQTMPSQLPQQTPSPAQFTAQVPSPYPDQPHLSTMHSNSSFQAVPSTKAGFNAPPPQTSPNAFSQAQSPDSTYGSTIRSQGFPPTPYSSNNEYENQSNSMSDYDYPAQRSESNFDFNNNRFNSIPGPGNTSSFPPQPPHTAPPMSQSSPYNNSYPDQRIDQRSGNDASRGMKRPYGDPQSGQRRFNGNQRGYSGGDGRRR